MSLPGADELFRTTGGMSLQSSSPRRQPNAEPRVPAPGGESDPLEAAEQPSAPQEHSSAGADTDAEGRSRGQEPAAQPGPPGTKPRRPQAAQEAAAAPARRGRGRGANRRPSGRERHDEKITVYVSAEELMDLEHARLVLRGEHGLAVDRGRIVREAVAVVLADLEQRGDASILVRRLRGR
ncbi:hypothetical protein GCM10010387_54790 [Streptomyces inusitatus]|uniref:Cobyrinic acid a,c-diamide synthase n=1 Tax=Streptomyces inusitatus TaxID=68221 RepID=A0A918QJT1_9ACTN|nr:hypothetical protein [Streptomyces inusitatus]GGZ53639.1 hypothetical protein GCM10010387_54790 [Streptomyces inusitatus]